MDPREIIDSIIDIEEAKNIDKTKVVDVIIEGLKKACEKQFGEDGNYIVKLNEATGQIDIIRRLVVVKNVTDEKNEISLETAKYLDPDIIPGDELEKKLKLDEFGRLAINVMKQYIASNILSEERDSLFNEYSAKIDTLVNGNIKKIDRYRVYINLHRLEAKMPIENGIPGERYRLGQLIKAVIIAVNKTKGDPEVLLSRRSDKFLKNLLEFEVPEIEEGTVVIKGIARRPGIKSKIAVMSIDDRIDPVGACVGVKGSRIHTIIRELNNEKIDIVQWSYDPTIFIQRVISPGIVIRAFKDEEEKTMKLIVKEDTYAQALGRDGINVELASELSGWRLDIINEKDFSEMEKDGNFNEIYKVSNLTDNQKEKLVEHGFDSPEEIVEKGEDELKKIDGLGNKTIKKILDAVNDYIKQGE